MTDTGTSLTSLGPETALPRPEARPWGRFVDAVPEISLVADGADRTCLGGVFMAPDAYSPTLLEINCSYEEADAKTATQVLSEQYQPGAQAYNMFACSTLAARPGELAQLVADDADSVLSEALASLATVQLTADHLALDTDSTAVTGGADTAEAIAAVEAGLADVYSNNRGYIFVPVGRLASAIASGGVRLIGERLVSATGHLVISDAGHGNADVIYGTGAMAYSISPTETMSSPTADISRNSLEWWRERCLAVFFNPAWSVSSTIG